MPTKRETARLHRLLPKGQPHYVRCYDNGGKTADRYTVCYTGKYRHKTGRRAWYVHMSENPYSPQGVGMHGESPTQIDTRDGRSYGGPAMGKTCHLGRRIPFSQLPEKCRELVIGDYCDLWDIPREVARQMLIAA